MVLEHEIPKGSRLYFGLSSRIKREIEDKAVILFNEIGFEEIVSPYFSYRVHHDIDDEKSLIRLSNDKNHSIILRNDTTLDVVRIITKRLGKSTTHKKWFYIQPVFRFPTIERYQIGLEWIDNESLNDVLKICVELFRRIGVSPILQLGNTTISKLISSELDIDINYFKSQNIELLMRYDFLKELIICQDKKDLEILIKKAPIFLKRELELLLSLGDGIRYEKLIFSPIFYTEFAYYDGLFFRAFSDNLTVAMGARYQNDGILSSGFAIYTDEVIELILNKKGS